MSTPPPPETATSPTATGASAAESLTIDDVAKVATLARLTMSDSQLSEAREQLASMLGHFADIDALDLDGVEPMNNPTHLANVMREDLEDDGLDRDEVLGQAPAVEDGRFRVPPIIGLEG